MDYCIVKKNLTRQNKKLLLSSFLRYILSCFKIPKDRNHLVSMLKASFQRTVNFGRFAGKIRV